MPSERDFLLVGVTGGIGSGKSLVCSLFERLGRTVFRADVIAQEITDGNQGVRKEVTRLLGREAYLEQGPLDRKFVAGRVFADHALLRKLNAIVHPPVTARVQELADALPSERRRPYVLVEAALVYESGMDQMLDKVIVVDAAEETRISRVMKRDGVDRDAVLLRMTSQLPAEVKAGHADFVIRNDENSTSLEEKVRFIDTLLTALGSMHHSVDKTCT
jgi:dephospho-CoA kinase